MKFLDMLGESVAQASNFLPSYAQTPFDYGDSKPWEDCRDRLQHMHDQWESSITDTVKKNRKARYIDVDIAQLKKQSKLRKDETIIPRRVIDTNIQRSIPPLLGFIKNTRRSVTFRCITSPAVQTKRLEREFTNIARYEGWEMPFFKTLDATKLHGWSWIQTTFDPSMPGNFFLRYLPTEDLIFPLDAIDIQSCDMISIRTPVTISKVKSWVNKYDFDQRQVDMLVANEQTDKFTDMTIDIFQVFYRAENGIVYTGWYNLRLTGWLKAPQKLYMGRKRETAVEENVSELQMSSLGPLHMGLETPDTPNRPVFDDEYEREYPVDLYAYNISEQQKIAGHKGRAFYDLHSQAAQTSIWSSFINQLTRSSNVYASPKSNNNASIHPELDKSVQLVSGGFYTAPVEFWNFPAPNQIALAALQALATENQSDTNQIAFQVLNRDDARKTKAEMNLASSEQNQINSTDITLWSIFIRRVYKRAWSITQSRALSGDLEHFFVVDPAEIERLREMDQFEAETESRDYLLRQKYEVRAAGDVEITESNERKQLLLEYLNLVRGTNAATLVLLELTDMLFPEDAVKFKRALLETRPTMDVIKAMSQIIQGLLQRFGDQIDEGSLQQITVMLQQGQEIVNKQPI